MLKKHLLLILFINFENTCAAKYICGDCVNKIVKRIWFIWLFLNSNEDVFTVTYYRFNVSE